MHKKGIIIGSAVGVTALFGLILTSGGVFATQTCETDATTGLLVCTDSTTGAKTYQRSASATASVTVASSCSFSVTRGTGYDNEKGYTATLANGATVPVPGSTFKTSCNDPGGYAIYAIGYSNNTFGNTDLIFNDTPDSSNNIQTDGSGSHWGMSLSATTTDHPSIESGFDAPGSPHVIPSTYTKIASYGSSTAGLNTETEEAELLEQAVTVTYSATASNTQPAGTYTGAVKYTMVHPSTAVAPDIDSMRYLQDLAGLSSAEKTALLANMVTGEQHQLADSRDGKLYYVAKLADGNIWMTQNLDHDIVSTADFYTYENTDIGHGSTPDTSAVWTGAATHISTNTIWGGSDSTPESYDPGDLCWKGTVISSFIGTLSDYTEACGSNRHYQVGNYYNWTAALAMNDSSSYTVEDTDLDQSICPAGWTLPKSGNTLTGSGSFYHLVNELNLTAGASGNVHNAPVYFVYGGYWNGLSRAVGGAGNYWSSVVYSDNIAFILAIDYPGYIDAKNDEGIRGYGYSVRCVAR